MKTVYIAEDGKRFKAESECEKHEEVFRKEETGDIQDTEEDFEKYFDEEEVEDDSCIEDGYDPFEDEYIPYEDRYISSAANGDYSPSSPWNAPGMSIRDFI